MDLFSQTRPADRQPVAAGRFYTSDKSTLSNQLRQLFTECKKPDKPLNTRAIISPHAGYMFSGKIAASAFSATSPDAGYKNIFLIGSSHVMAFEGASVYHTGDFITPLGRAVVNREIGEKLRKDNSVFNFPTTAHNQDHCLEVQIPFIQHYYKNTPKIVPVIIGTTNPVTIRKIAEALSPWFTAENLFIISSDFSHYPSYKDGIKTDELTATGLISGDPDRFLSGLRKNASANIPNLATSMCGWSSGLTLLYLTEGRDEFEYVKLDYCNSGDSEYGSKDEVVGYHAIAVVEKNDKKTNSGSLTISGEEKDILFSIARNTIKSTLAHKKEYIIDESIITPGLRKTLGAFVTLKINGVLRGCIGRFVSEDPLYKVVKSSAYSSAFEDPRFPALSEKEYEKTEMEITVLGPHQKIESIKEIELGRHGIYIRKGPRSGTMLPQVAIEHGWTVEEFLGYTSRDKAGIGWDGWKDAEIYIYEGKVLEENRK
ncbi:MAG TPA: AmmeMemoRadiSam system protein B [Bacteroidales bacterium]|nr:AmmeMemoRadiSam system protein B [Bacteroidales bacterium]HPF04094.1 AmmeMemoRadiSam system protein B [Bacteroidales bacterium]HPJ59546.1 AmmeMemoRadiSam system protein B [Bacteroidales bacterium]HPR12083.1 AmmeMemoRadiSam system protein B [Bacteroidales bacterium]HRW86203.1 AmmeMemoRadiSam system protein B [Bacteroidales bacterium]